MARGKMAENFWRRKNAATFGMEQRAAENFCPRQPAENRRRKTGGTLARGKCGIRFFYARLDRREPGLRVEIASAARGFAELPGRLVLHPGPRHASRRARTRPAARRNDSGPVRRARRQNDVHRP